MGTAQSISMIDTTTALQMVLSQVEPSPNFMELDLLDAVGTVLAADVVSPIAMPPFRQSAMDGYAVNANGADRYRLVGEVQAGAQHRANLKPGEAVRIFTGAAVPRGATAVVMQEKVKAQGEHISLQMEVQPEMNIRPQGEQVKKGAVALERGTRIKGAHVGFLAGLGLTKVRVRQKPSIAIVVTGNELVSPGKPLPHGKIYESNGLMLQATLGQLGYRDLEVVRVPDDPAATQGVLGELMQKVDVVLTTGGVSVGDYDFVGQALLELGVEQVFHKVKQKPGKPLFFGKKGKTAIFGLPGNPGAALNCLYIYVCPYLEKWQGAQRPGLLRLRMPLAHAHSVKGDRAQFLKARLAGGSVSILGGQSSAMVKAFGEANALVFLPGNAGEVPPGEAVEVILLPLG
ncbi:gephyrin-like molybdotransferase Glp [Maribacter sp. 2307ULW6-5]|uniref:molybdopterin molybdotransferase MoeA n=1 Tax=Maribacter sp. 2307ULW6-5 TaxID=3386275 RepID=UPI0039BCDFD7